jgi:hypothetical protein
MSKLRFCAGARLASLRVRTIVSLMAMGLAAVCTAWGGPTPVSATPGIIQGIVTFTAPFVPDSMEVDARDSSNQYTATAQATQNDPVNCAPGSPNWCYSVTVESALANAYYLRPIAYISESSPIYVTDRVPFPPTSLVNITKGATVNQNIAFQPGEISGAVTGNDMNSNPLQVNSIYLSLDDLSNTFAEPCGGSLDFCPFNSVFDSSAAPLPAAADYEIFVKPLDNYNYLTRGISFLETGGATTNIQFNGNQPLGATPAAGVDETQNYNFNQIAAINGTLSVPGQQIYDFYVTAEGSTTTGGGMYEQYNYQPQYIPSTPLAQPLNFTERIFDLTDLTQPVSIQPVLTLSTDGQTLVQYPAQSVTGLTAGSILPVNYSGTAATISGRVTFNPPYPVTNIYPGIQSVTQDGGLAQTNYTPDAMGGTYMLPAFGDNWYYWRFGWNFNLGRPGFTSNYLVGQFLYAPAVPDVVVSNGGTATANFTFPTAIVKVFFSAPTAPAGSTISNPALAMTTGSYSGTTFSADFVETGASAGPGTNVASAEADAVLRVHGVPFQITPSAWINTPSAEATGPTTFSPIVLNPNPGDVIIVGIPGTLSLTVSSPQNGATVNTCQIPVSQQSQRSLPGSLQHDGAMHWKQHADHGHVQRAGQYFGQRYAHGLFDQRRDADHGAVQPEPVDVRAAGDLHGQRCGDRRRLRHPHWLRAVL